MGRIKPVLGLVAVMAAMMVALAAPALAKDNHGHKGGGNNHRIEQRIDHFDNHFDGFDNRFGVDLVVSDVDFDPWYAWPWWGGYWCEGPVCLID
jgi:hypothetical protein